MFNSNVAPSISDIAAVTRNDDFGFGNGWWILILVFAILGGGFWGNGYRGAGYDADIQRGFDFTDLSSKINQVGNGIASLGYDQLAQMNGINQNIMTSAFGLQNSVRDVQAQVSDCCCQNREAVAQVRYDLGAGTAALANTINQQAQNIMQNDNHNYRQLHDEIVQIQMDSKDTRIADLTAQVQALTLAASQQRQNAYLLNELKPCPIPAYTVANPYSGNYGYGCYNA